MSRYFQKMKIKSLFREISNLFAWRDIPVNAAGLVLDVASGDNPHVRADVLCDAHLCDSGERSGRFGLIVDGRPFVFADACRLPFKDKAFDFVVCRHLLEHVADPAVLLEELMRVGRAGYIETPSVLMEKFCALDFHRSTVDLQDGSLVIRAKSAGRKPGILPEEIRKSSHWESVVDRHRDKFIVSYFWDGKISYRVEGEFPPAEGLSRESFSRLPRRSLRRRMRWWVTRFIRFFTARPDFKMDGILVCPACGGAVKTEKDKISCLKCNAVYPILNKNFYKFI